MSQEIALRSQSLRRADDSPLLLGYGGLKDSETAVHPPSSWKKIHSMTVSGCSSPFSSSKITHHFLSIADNHLQEVLFLLVEQFLFIPFQWDIRKVIVRRNRSACGLSGRLFSGWRYILCCCFQRSWRKLSLIRYRNLCRLCLRVSSRRSG